jgi:hypothetical protein
MTSRFLAATLLSCMAGVGLARADVGLSPGARCEQAIGFAARTNHVPIDLMNAIGLVETGRPDPATGAWRPWPWAINAEGRGMFFESKADAVATVRKLQAEGVKSIDVGCMQVNLMHHPDAFDNLDEAFDPARNALYASRFLSGLFRRSSNWLVAAGWYHSGTTELAEDYVRRVKAVLPGGSRSPALRASVLSLTWRGAMPVVSRDGMVLPSVRLSASGMVPGRQVGRPVRVKARQGSRIAG